MTLSISQNSSSDRTFNSSGVHIFLNLGHRSFLFFITRHAYITRVTTNRQKKTKQIGHVSSRLGTHASNFWLTGNWPRSPATVHSSRIIARTAVFETCLRVWWTSFIGGLAAIKILVETLDRETRIISRADR